MSKFFCNRVSAFEDFFRKFKVFTKLKVKDKILFFEAYALTGMIRVIIMVIPFKRIYKYAGNSNNESPYGLEGDERDRVKRIKKFIHMASKNTPWASKCLVKAMAAQNMLKRRNISTTLYLGVKKEKNTTLKAHSWLRCGNIIVTGGECKDEYTIVSKISNYKK